MKKEEKLSVTKEKLINAAIELMKDSADGSGVTSRAIAEKAGVRLSMINYCFGSKEAMLFEAFSKNETEYRNDPYIQNIVSADISPKEKLKRLHLAAAELLINRYKFTRAITGYVLLHRDLSKEPASLPFIKEHFGGLKTEQECRLISYELSGMMQLAVYRMEDIKKNMGLDLRNSEQLRNYINMRIDMLLGE